MRPAARLVGNSQGKGTCGEEGGNSQAYVLRFGENCVAIYAREKLKKNHK